MVALLAGGWPRLNSEKRIWVPRPCGFQGAVFVPGLLGCPTHRDTILLWELSSKTPTFLAEFLCFVERECPSKPLFDYLEGGETLEEFLEGFPTVSREAAVAALEEAKHLLLARS